LDIPNVLEHDFIKENIDSLGWKGEGTETDPIIIDDDSNLPVSMILKTEDLYIKMQNIDINMIILDKCQNIIVEDCTISVIKLKSCKNIVVRNNLIREVKNYYGSNNLIENNRLYAIFNVRQFTVIMFFTAISVGSLAILSYFIEQFFLRDIFVIILLAAVIVFCIEIMKKRSKRFLPKYLKNNVFITSTSKEIDFDLVYG
jgi:hypothetical protein